MVVGVCVVAKVGTRSLSSNSASTKVQHMQAGKVQRDDVQVVVRDPVLPPSAMLRRARASIIFNSIALNLLAGLSSGNGPSGWRISFFLSSILVATFCNFSEERC